MHSYERLLVVKWNHFSISNSAYSCTFLRRVVYLSSTCHMLSGFRCHLAGTLVVSSDTLC